MEQIVYLNILLALCKSDGFTILNEQIRENGNIEQYIKDQFYVKCFGSAAMQKMKDKISQSKSECSSLDTMKTTPPPVTTKNTSTTTTTSPTTTSRWSWISPRPSSQPQYPIFTNFPLLNPLQFYPVPFQPLSHQQQYTRRPRMLSENLSAQSEVLKSKMNEKVNKLFGNLMSSSGPGPSPI